MLGGAVAPRGGDVAGGIRPTHSPTVVHPRLGPAYRDSGRTTPIMDGFAFHPYEDNSSIAPVRRHASEHDDDRARRLRQARRAARRGVPARATSLPIWYDEFGVESQIPAAKQALYTGTEPATTKPVDEATQAAYYRQAMQLAFCQPNVRGLFLFHAVDETRPRRLAVGPLLRGRHAEVEPRRRYELAIERVAARRRRALRRARAAR